VFEITKAAFLYMGAKQEATDSERLVEFRLDEPFYVRFSVQDSPFLLWSSVIGRLVPNRVDIDAFMEGVVLYCESPLD